MDGKTSLPTLSRKHHKTKLCPLCFAILPAITLGSAIFSIVCGVFLNIFFIQISMTNLSLAVVLSASLFLFWNFANYSRHFSEHRRYQKAVRTANLQCPASVQAAMEQIKTALLVEPVTHRDDRWRSISHIAGDHLHEVMTAELPFNSLLQVDIELRIDATRNADGTTVEITYFCPYEMLTISHASAFEKTTDLIAKALQPHLVATPQTTLQLKAANQESPNDNLAEGTRLKIPEPQNEL